MTRLMQTVALKSLAVRLVRSIVKSAIGGDQQFDNSFVTHTTDQMIDLAGRISVLEHRVDALEKVSLKTNQPQENQDDE